MELSVTVNVRSVETRRLRRGGSLLPCSLEDPSTFHSYFLVYDMLKNKHVLGILKKKYPGSL